MAASIDRSVRFSLAPVWAYACGVAAEFAPANYSNWRHVARDLAICLSLANLLFVITAERLETSYWVYVQNHPGWMSWLPFMSTSYWWAPQFGWSCFGFIAHGRAWSLRRSALCSCCWRCWR